MSDDQPTPDVSDERPYGRSPKSDAELLKFLESCERQSWFISEKAVFRQLQQRLRLVSERIPEADPSAGTVTDIDLGELT